MCLLFGTWLMCVAYLIFSPLSFFEYLSFCGCVYVFQEEAAVPLSTHSQAVSIRHPEADALPDPSHSENHSKTSASLSLFNSLSMWITLSFCFAFFSPYCQLVALLCVLQLPKSESFPDSLDVCCLFREENTLLNFTR